MNYSPGALLGLSQDPGIIKPKEEGATSPLAVEAMEVMKVVEVVEVAEVVEVMGVNPCLNGPV